MDRSVYAWEVDGSAVCVLNEKKVMDSLARGLIKVTESPDGEEAVARIGDYWFYFGESIPWMEYMGKSSQAQVAADIIDAMEELGEAERSYYIFVLEESVPSPVFHVPVTDEDGKKASTCIKGMFKDEAEAADWAAKYLI